MEDWAPFMFLLFFGLLFFFGRWLYSILFSDEEEEDYVRRKEGLETMAVNTTIQQGTYSTVADNRALFLIYPNNLFLDFKGMNLVDIDYITDSYYELTVVTRAGKQFYFKTKSKDIPAIDATFFKQDKLVNLKGTYTPFMYQSDWQSASNNVIALVVPYTDVNVTDHTFLVLWDNSNVSNGLVLMSVNLYSSTVTEARSAFSINTADFPKQSLVTASAILSGETTPPVVNSSNGLPYLYSSSSVSIATTVTNASVIMSQRTVKNPHYYYLDGGVRKYPDLQSITPFVYFNPMNGDVIILQGQFGTRKSSKDTFVQTTTWTPDSEVELETDASFKDMIKTTSVRRYRRPLNATVIPLTDYKDNTTLFFDTFTKDANDDQRSFQDTDSPWTIRTSLASMPSFAMCICNSVLDKRLVYHLTTGLVSVLVVVAKNGKELQVEKVRIFENGGDKANTIIYDPYVLPETEYSKYQNQLALTSSSSSTSSSTSTSGTTTSSSTSTTTSGVDLSSALAGSSLSGDSLGAVEKKAVYDLIASLLFSRDAYSTATGYTTKNCPACTTTPSSSTPAAATTDTKTSTTTTSATTSTTTTKPATTTTTPATKTTTLVSGLPAYESQAQTSLRSAGTDTSSTTTTNPNQASVKTSLDDVPPAASSGYSYTTKKMDTIQPPPSSSSSSSSSQVNRPSPGYPRFPNTSFMVDSYLRRPPNPNYRPPMPVAFDFSKIGWNT